MSKELKGKTINEPTLTEKCAEAKGSKHVWRTTLHLDFSSKSITNYYCEHCGEVVTQTYYRMDDEVYEY